MTPIISRCPGCGALIRATRLSCTQCPTQLEGQFDIPPLLRLPAEDLAFITAFVRSSGSLKEMAKHTGTSYPTVRNRLNSILEALSQMEKEPSLRQHEILDAVEKGQMTAQQAALELRKVGL